ncbi:unnamed protein product [Effrenium voratum]|uniref:Ion transport domain-containing protein n=1 Tax=Effrenium voratum TaxID=2562239 RepID=A0AA36N9Z0_9DINO|nr:unnamed protein product [Effrenium voratum]|mmetsp:Transcript_133836/g.317230  ORF Transcript_133836/g.317230 Transcript_133836/m.317230 type:complete len:472 (-) Transcript_133836:41-1456(-)|eukprot:CAMPEP_0181433308 /NCGR_PEP_ID=MMETSP1110-20121109/19222_1 /TAXON_ID=174948 /ORGANISM="Symbiodinium sp., Strain CCMP421" /LENGTH=471 /DNA_ID=CAMNT_0023556751 /DNA_START=66 /DNA_END=1481 /DNA_ORIENTATION=-
MQPLRFHHKEKEDDSEEEQKEAPISAEDAAKIIQSHWRKAGGAKRTIRRIETQRTDRLPPQDVDRPFYTHTLGLTFVSHTQKRMEEETKSLAEKLFLLLSDPNSSSAAQLVSIVIVAFTVLSICGFVLETDRELYEVNPDVWLALEVVCTMVFTAEYLALSFTCRAAGIPLVKFITAPSSIADLIALLPFYVEVILRSTGFTHTTVLKAFKVVRLIRVVRVFKLGRYAAGMQIMWKAVVDSRQAISVLLFLLCTGVVAFASTLYYLERLSCPMREVMDESQLALYLNECSDVFNRGVSPSHGLCCTEDNSPVDMPSIIAACWWAVVTLTSLGYGDMYPKTLQGKCVGVLAMIAGLLLIALPIAIISQKFQDIYEVNDKEEAKNRAAQRMKGAPHETWTLIPGSDVVRRLKGLSIKDPEAREAIQDMMKSLEEIWERREALERERKYAMSQMMRFHKGFDKLLVGMMSSDNL